MRLAYLAARPDPHLVKALRDAGHLVEAADRHGLELGGWGGGFDALILDEPDPSPEAVRQVAALAGGAFVVVVGAPGEEGARAGLLRAGADACLPRPVSLIELQARLEALARAWGRRPDQPTAAGRLRLLPAARAAALDGRTVALTAKEFQVLEALIRRPGEVLAPAEIVRLAWGEDADVDPALVSTYVARLRAKLERPSGTPMIRAVRGHGYCFEGP